MLLFTSLHYTVKKVSFPRIMKENSLLHSLSRTKRQSRIFHWILRMNRGKKLTYLIRHIPRSGIFKGSKISHFQMIDCAVFFTFLQRKMIRTFCSFIVVLAVCMQWIQRITMWDLYLPLIFLEYCRRSRRFEVNEAGKTKIQPRLAAIHSLRWIMTKIILKTSRVVKFLSWFTLDLLILGI